MRLGVPVVAMPQDYFQEIDAIVSILEAISRKRGRPGQNFYFSLLSLNTL